jgi:hypothetical protein
VQVTIQDIGIAIAAVASLSSLLISVIRLRMEQHNVIARLSVGEPDWEDPTTAYITAAVFNRGRPAYIDGMSLRVGPDTWSIGSEAQNDNGLPQHLATGRSYRIGFDLSRFEGKVAAAADAFSFPLRYTPEDLPNMRLRVTDGDGHDHWGEMDEKSVRNIREVLRNRAESAVAG